MTALLRNIVHFSRLLHALGLDVHAGRVKDVAAALEHVGVGSRIDFYYTLRSLLIHRREDLAMFDEAFRAFWRARPGDGLSHEPEGIRRRRLGSPHIDIPLAPPHTPHEAPSLHQPIDRVAPASYSPRDVSRSKNFAEFTQEELDQARAVIAALTWELGMRRTRRWTPGRGRMPDFRRILRHSLRYGGELLDWPMRERIEKRRPLVLLCDVSGSMERYARMLLHFIDGVAASGGRVEAFVFATRLTRITRELGRRGRSPSLPTIPRRVQDWAGGTRIGEALRTFNIRWARRVMGHGPVVLLISDGWDRGDPEVLAREMSRLQRSCHRLIWLNPLLGSAGYEPLTRGMRAALPFIDDFLPAHNLASLDSLAEHLNRLPSRRAARRTGGTSGPGISGPASG